MVAEGKPVPASRDGDGGALAWIAPLATALACLAIWEAAIHWFKVPVYVLPTPIDVVRKMFVDYRIFYQQALPTLSAILMGFGLAVAVGVALMIAPAAASGTSRYTLDNPPRNPTTRDLDRMGIAYTKWAALGRCEQPGAGWDNTPRYRWARGVHWRHTGPRYLAGLGLFAGTYRAWTPPGYPWPPKATPEQIVIIAERVRRDVGITAWGAWRCWQ